ncbi:MAG: hypothetical protein IPO56_10880 [Flavobacteriales bacterium]|nr:hypothetical protein [Flavobacteriales bacterium]
MGWRSAPSSRAALIGLGAACALLLFIFYRSVLLSPNAVLSTQSGDGLKNYYTLVQHAHGSGNFWNMNGMNHPYGEHVVYTDGHPWLSAALRSLKPVFPDIADYSVGILNMLMVLGMPLCAFVLFALFRSFDVRPWLAAAGAFGITVLAPQTNRIGGHLGLSYSVFIPLTWYVLVRIERDRRWFSWASVLCIIQLFWWATHPYIGAMASLFAGLFCGAMVWIKRTERTMLRRWSVAFVLACALPMLLFRTTVGLTDHHKGRSEHPSGFFNYTAEPDDILLPSAPPLRPVLDRLTNGGIRTQWEAQAYVGAGSTLVLLSWAFIAMRRRMQRRKGEPLPVALRGAWWSSLLLLLFAFCIPFKDFPELLDHLPILEQFRATGRFTWPFYFVITVTALFLLDKWTRNAWWNGKVAFATGLALLLPLSWVIEGASAHVVGKGFDGSPNVFSRKHSPQAMRELWERQEHTTYQAILPMPYFNFGSESFTRPSLDGITRAALSTSQALRLPILGSILSRVSVPESRSLTQLVSQSWYHKPVADLLRKDQPFLIVRSDEALTANEAKIIGRAHPIDSIDGIRLYRISHDELFTDHSAEVLENFQRLRPALDERNGYLIAGDAPFFTVQEFEDRPATITKRGSGAFSTAKKGVHVVAELELKGIHQGDELVLSVWMFNGAPEALNMGLRLEVAQAMPDGTEQVDIGIPNETETIDGDWSMLEFTVVARTNDPLWTVRTVCRDRLDRTLILDDLVIRPAGCTIYNVESANDKTPKGLFMNGHWIRDDHGILDRTTFTE